MCHGSEPGGGLKQYIAFYFGTLWTSDIIFLAASLPPSGNPEPIYRFLFLGNLGLGSPKQATINDFDASQVLVVPWWFPGP